MLGPPCMGFVVLNGWATFLAGGDGWWWLSVACVQPKLRFSRGCPLLLLLLLLVECESASVLLR